MRPLALVILLFTVSCRHSGPSGIQIVSAAFGRNCTSAPADGTEHLAVVCNGKPRCQYLVDHEVIGDPRKACTKSYLAKWRCGSDPQVHQVEVLESREPPYTAIADLVCPGS